MTRSRTPHVVLTALAATGLALLSGCGVMADAGRGVSTAGNAVTNTSTATQQQIHDATGAAKQ